MAIAFSERPRWYRWLTYGLFGFGLLLVALVLAARTLGPEESADLRPFVIAMDRLAKNCNAAQAKVGAALGRGGDPVALAGDVRRMKEACQAAWLAVNDVPAPEDMTDEQAEGVAAARVACKTVFFSRGDLADQLMRAVDGDTRPSVMAGLEASAARVREEAAACNTATGRLAPV